SCCVFFKVEGGIRDWSVTGVQTCALPISDPDAAGQVPEPAPAAVQVDRVAGQGVPAGGVPGGAGGQVAGVNLFLVRPDQDPAPEIGRASCRERVSDPDGSED